MHDHQLPDLLYFDFSGSFSADSSKFDSHARVYVCAPAPAPRLRLHLPVAAGAAPAGPSIAINVGLTGEMSVSGLDLSRSSPVCVPHDLIFKMYAW